MYKRFIVTVGIFTIAIIIWNIIVSFNNDGMITGRVVGPSGFPIAGATVVLSEKSLLVTVRRDSTITDEDGRFKFTEHRFHHIWLQASKHGVGISPLTEFRLYFRSQNLALPEPLRLMGNTTIQQISEGSEINGV